MNPLLYPTLIIKNTALPFVYPSNGRAVLVQTAYRIFRRYEKT